MRTENRRTIKFFQLYLRKHNCSSHSEAVNRKREFLNYALSLGQISTYFSFRFDSQIWFSWVKRSSKGECDINFMKFRIDYEWKQQLCQAVYSVRCRLKTTINSSKHKCFELALLAFLSFLYNNTCLFTSIISEWLDMSSTRESQIEFK